MFSAPEEHQDTAAVLAALDQFTVCRVRTRELGATAILTIADSLVQHALIFWPDGDGPSYDSVVAMVGRMHGAPFQNQWGVRYWAADSLKIVLNRRGPYGPGTTVSLSDARLCERYEALVHRTNTVDHRSYPCW